VSDQAARGRTALRRFRESFGETGTKLVERLFRKASAYGEVVWSWRSDAGAKFAGLNESGDRRWQPSMVTGEITYKP
jgi:hypothetical protein